LCIRKSVSNPLQSCEISQEHVRGTTAKN